MKISNEHKKITHRIRLDVLHKGITLKNECRLIEKEL